MDLIEHKRSLNTIPLTKRSYLTALRKIELTNPSVHYIGTLTNLCLFCQAQYFSAEKSNVYTKCCSSGKIVLPALQSPPDEIVLLYTGRHPLSNDFKKHIRNYNSSLAFASMSCNIESNNSRGPYVFKMHGQIYHSTYLLNVEDRPPTYCQYYILNTAEAHANRSRQSDQYNLNSGLLIRLHDIITEVNPYASAFKSMS